jgi:hypothetical protein
VHLTEAGTVRLELPAGYVVVDLSREHAGRPGRRMNVNLVKIE